MILAVGSSDSEIARLILVMEESSASFDGVAGLLAEASADSLGSSTTFSAYGLVRL
jgi:hypothetical protein